MILSPVDSPDWPEIEASLRRVKEKTGERWSLPFVISRIREGKAGLFRFLDSEPAFVLSEKVPLSDDFRADTQRWCDDFFGFRDKHIAYMVCERCEQGEAPWMNVWILEGAGLERASECVPLIDELARSVGASAWRCFGRKGWGRALSAYLAPQAVVYERALL